MLAPHRLVSTGLRPTATCLAMSIQSDFGRLVTTWSIQHEFRTQYRHASTSTPMSDSAIKHGRVAQNEPSRVSTLPPHSLLPTKMLLRSLLITSILSKPYLVGPALKFMLLLTKKPFALLDVNKNPVLFHLLKRTFHNQFCAGENKAEVTRTVRSIKEIGFKGVILTYAREIVVDESSKQERGMGMHAVAGDNVENELAEKKKFADIEAWKTGVLETLEMVGEGDFLALKFTGAGLVVGEALRSNTPLPAPMQDALEMICDRAVQRNVRILVDAEQQSVQPSIDAIALKLMNEYNRGTAAVVYNTYQMYLKSSVGTLDQHMREAGRQGYILGVKIVRGAYMNSEPRELIHDSKADTDAAYDSSVKVMIEAKYVIQESEQSHTDREPMSPSVDLFLASHNKESALSALRCHQERINQGLPTVNRIQYGQLLGMADEVSCGLLLKGRDMTTNTEDSISKTAGPDVYKCLSWGTLEDCMSYLVRRAVENKDAVTRTKSEQVATKKELWRRSRALLGLGV